MMIKNCTEANNESQSGLILYTTDDGRSRISVRLDEQTVWLTQKLMAELFQVSVPTVNEHLRNIYQEGEVPEEGTIRNFLIVQTEGQRQVSREVAHYSLDAILAVGYRVRSHRGTQFRQWATERLREYLVKGFTMDDERLKHGTTPADYFDELLERIRDIRASERRFYQKITDIYSTAVDYSPDAEITKQFFATVQNKMHWAIHGHTAAELVHKRADASLPNMGLTTWKGQRIRKTDVTVAKNYLNEEELRALNRIVTMYLDYAEMQAERHITMTMADWARKIDDFLRFNEHEILQHVGRISQKLAEEHACGEFAKWKAEQRRIEAEAPTSDFDKAVADIKRIHATDIKRDTKH